MKPEPFLPVSGHSNTKQLILKRFYKRLNLSDRILTHDSSSPGNAGSAAVDLIKAIRMIRKQVGTNSMDQL